MIEVSALFWPRVKIGGKWQMVGPNDAERTSALLKGISGKRLTYPKA
jgi:hypothetical protein